MLPTNRAPAHPGQILQNRFLNPLGLTQRQAAILCGFNQHRTINEICNGKRSVTPETALIFAKVFSTSPEFWLNLQRNFDLWHAQHSPKIVKRLEHIEKVNVAALAA